MEHPRDPAVAAAKGRPVESHESTGASGLGDPQCEYREAVSGAGIHDARQRGLIEITGADRATWLHNLVTNTVKTLRPGEGNYAFVLNVKGRILLDCNILVLSDRIWLDVDRQWLGKAVAHLERYHITEDVRLADLSPVYARIALAGPKSADIAAGLGATQAANMAYLGSTTVVLAGKPRLMVRNDAAGLFGLEFFVETADAEACRKALMEIGGAAIHPIGQAALEVLRIEAGIPVYGQDIDEETLPAETGQLERGVSFVKGCYLGQEIVERMRSRGGLARRLVGLRLSTSSGVRPGSVLRLDGAEAGRLTSFCESYAVGGPIGLGYVKAAHANPGTRLIVEATDPVDAEVCPLPFRK